MIRIHAVHRPGTAKDYLPSRVELAKTYPMHLFTTDLADQQEPLYGFHVTGPCPRCGDPTTGLVPTKYLSTVPFAESADAVVEPTEAGRVAIEARRGALPADIAYATYEESEIRTRSKKPSAALKAVALRCHCPVTHDKTGGKVGCGAEWMLAFEYQLQPERTVTLSPVAAEEEVKIWIAADAVAALVATAGQTAMGLASKWITVFASLVGVITLGGVLGGHDTIQKLPWGWEVALGLATLVALVANVVMIYQGNIAGSGYPELLETVGVQDLAQADIQPLKDADATVKRLRKAKKAAWWTGIAAAVAVGIFLFVPPASTATTNVKVKYTKTTTPASGTTPAVATVHQTGCGKLEGPAADGKYTFKPDQGSSLPILPTELNEVDAC